MNYRLPIMLLVATLSSTGLKAADKVEKPTFSKVTIPTTSNMFQGNHAFADMNADGKMDLLVKGRNLDNGWNPEAFALISTVARHKNLFRDLKWLAQGCNSYRL